MSKRHPLDDALQNKLRDYSMPVPPEMWQNIEGEMSRKRYPVWLPWIMSTVAVATLGLVGYLLLSDDAINKTKSDNSPEPTADASRIQVIDSEEDKYSLSERLSKDDGIEDHSGKTVTDEALLETGGESQASNSTELLQYPEQEGLRESGALLSSEAIISSEDKRNSNRKRNNKVHSGLSNMDRTDSDVGANNASLKKAEEYPKDEQIESVSVKVEDELVESQNLSDAGKYTLSNRDARLAALGTAPAASLNNWTPTYYVHSDAESMGLPKLRKLRDRNCEDEQFSPGNIFLEFSYSLHHGNLNFRSTDEIFDSYANLRTNGEQFKLSRQFQGLIAFQVGKRAYFKTGISLNVIESDYYFVDQVNKRTIRDSIWNDRTMEYEVTETVADIYIDGINKYTFIDIPLLFSYGWQFNKIGMNLTTGPLVNISFTREGSLPSLIGQGIDLDDGLWNDRDIYRKTAGLSWFLSTQISYQAYRNVDIYIEPRIISGLNSVTLENDGKEVEISKTSYPLSQRVFQYGVGAGLRFSLNNK